LALKSPTLDIPTIFRCHFLGNYSKLTSGSFLFDMETPSLRMPNDKANRRARYNLKTFKARSRARVRFSDLLGAFDFDFSLWNSPQSDEKGASLSSLLDLPPSSFATDQNQPLFFLASVLFLHYFSILPFLGSEFSCNCPKPTTVLFSHDTILGHFSILSFLGTEFFGNQPLFLLVSVLFLVAHDSFQNGNILTIESLTTQISGPARYRAANELRRFPRGPLERCVSRFLPLTLHGR
jgi:hypothetical protein